MLGPAAQGFAVFLRPLLSILRGERSACASGSRELRGPLQLTDDLFQSTVCVRGIQDGVPA